MTTRPFRFGVVAGRPSSGADWLAAARGVEAFGYDTLLLPDTTFTPSPFPALAAAAAATSSLRVGTWVLAAPFRTPAVVVRETSALQLLSGGRFELGIGTGRPDAAAEAQLLGQEWGSVGDRITRLVETVAAVRAQVSPVPRVAIAAVGRRILSAEHHADTVALALPPDASIEQAEQVGDLARAGGDDPELALQMSGVGGRLVGHLARQGFDPEGLRGAAGVLDGDADEMAGTLLDLRRRTGISYVCVAAEHAETFASVRQALAGA